MSHKDVKHALSRLFIFASVISVLMVMTISCAATPSIPSIQIVKTTNGVDAANAAQGPIVPVGSTVTWEYVVTNTGNQPLININVNDNPAGLVNNIISKSINNDDTLDMGESWTYNKTGIAISGAYSNTVTVTGIGWTGTTASATDTSYYTGEVPIPEFPTIAIPMLAIIGLAFVFTRRKE